MVNEHDKHHFGLLLAVLCNHLITCDIVIYHFHENRVVNVLFYVSHKFVSMHMMQLVRNFTHKYDKYTHFITTAACYSSQFTYQNGNCISSTLKCDKSNNCGDNSDEFGCGKHILQCVSKFSVWFSCSIQNCNGTCVNVYKELG